ncbi:hypothetical protein [Streptomyces sp. NEAU-S7GS2]|uniref:hypothetical protein n=1 Tax=Streptomyces sp. NEAU-S7GS2 TaxID=2202000 RepID=UPI0013A5BA1B|nr:hypothetical protein [Streptomyces sp. NEAU-S7GS2]
MVNRAHLTGIAAAAVLATTTLAPSSAAAAGAGPSSHRAPQLSTAPAPAPALFAGCWKAKTKTAIRINHSVHAKAIGSIRKGQVFCTDLHFWGGPFLKKKRCGTQSNQWIQADIGRWVFRGCLKQQ